MARIDMSDPRKLCQLRRGGAIQKSSPEVLHCKGKNGAACGHEGEALDA